MSIGSMTSYTEVWAACHLRSFGRGSWIASTTSYLSQEDEAATRCRRGTVRKVHTVLRLALEQAVRWQWLAENPAVHASPPSASRRESKPPTGEEAQALL